MMEIIETILEKILTAVREIQQSVTRRKTWEHLTLPVATSQRLDQLGEAGWELVTVVETVSGSNRYTQYYFKRERSK